MKRLLILLIIFLNIFSLNAQNKTSFTIKTSKNLPSWFDNIERKYSLNDDRIVDYENVEYIGGYDSKKGEFFFINNKEFFFSDKQIKIIKTKNIITKSFTSGDYLVKLILDPSLSTGSYSEGNISLSYKNKIQFKSKLIISGF